MVHRQTSDTDRNYFISTPSPRESKSITPPPFNPQAGDRCTVKMDFDFNKVHEIQKGMIGRVVLVDNGFLNIQFLEDSDQDFLI